MDKKIGVLLLCMLGAAPAMAMYRCGNVFQDRPCEAGQPEQRLSPSGQPTTGPVARPTAPTAPSAASSSQFAAVCARQGQNAQTIVWKREGGATLERQLAEMPSGGNREEMRNLIESVYQRRGTMPEIKAAIEAECVAQKQKEAAAAEILKNLRGGEAAPAQQPAARGVAEAPAGAEAAAARAAANAAAAKAAECKSLKSQMDNLQSRLRAGGSAAEMERLQEQRRRLDKSTSDTKC